MHAEYLISLLMPDSTGMAENEGLEKAYAICSVLGKLYEQKSKLASQPRYQYNISSFLYEAITFSSPYSFPFLKETACPFN